MCCEFVTCSKLALFRQYSLIKTVTHLLLANVDRWELQTLISRGTISSRGDFKVSLMSYYIEKIPNRNYVLSYMCIFINLSIRQKQSLFSVLSTL